MHPHGAAGKRGIFERGLVAKTRLVEALEHKADRDDLENCSSDLQDLREDVGDLEGQLVAAESRIDDLEGEDWS